MTVTLMSDTAIGLSWVLVRKAAGLLTPGLDHRTGAASADGAKALACPVSELSHPILGASLSDSISGLNPFRLVGPVAQTGCPLSGSTPLAGLASPLLAMPLSTAHAPLQHLRAAMQHGRVPLEGACAPPYACVAIAARSLMASQRAHRLAGAVRCSKATLLPWSAGWSRSVLRGRERGPGSDELGRAFRSRQKEAVL